MGIFDRKQKSQDMKLISAIVATVSASAMTKTGQWNGVDESNTCGMTFEWQDANGDPLSIVNATCSWEADSTITFAYGDNGAFVAGSNAVTGFEPGSDGSASVRFFFAQTCVNGTCDNSTCWEFTSPPNCEANPNNGDSPVCTSKRTSTITVEAKQTGTSRSRVPQVDRLSPSNSETVTKSPT